MGAPVYDRKVRPSGWWYAAAGVIAVGGILAGLAVAAKGVDDALEAIRSFDRTPVPGVVDVQITEPGGYSIYQEFPGAADRGGTTSPPDVIVTGPDGTPVELKEYGTFVSYDQGNLEGRGIYTFRADQAGTFHVVAAGGSGSTIAVGRGMGDLSTRAVAGIFGGVIGGAILSLAGIATAIVVAIAIGITRGRSRRRRRIYGPVPLAPLAGNPTPAMTTWPAAPTAMGWQPMASSPHPNGSPRPAWPSQQVTTATQRAWSSGPTSPTSPGSAPNGAGSPGPHSPPGLPTTPAVGGTPAFGGSPGLPAATGVAGSPGAGDSSGLPAAAGVVGSPGEAGSPGVSGSEIAGPPWPLVLASPTPGPATGTVPAGASVPVSASPASAPAGVAVPSGAAASGPASRPPGAGTRVMASTGAAVGARAVTGESTLVGPAPTLVQAGSPEGSAPTEPLSRPGDPQSLRSPVDWSRSDLELPWETEGGETEARS